MLDESGRILQLFESNKATYHELFMLKFKTARLEKKRKSLCKKKHDAPSAKFICSGEEDTVESKTEKKKSALFVMGQHWSKIYA